MGMKVSSLPFLLFLPRHHDNAVSCINSRVLLNAIPHRERKEISAELSGIFKQETKEHALLNLAANLRQIPEALS